MGEASWDLSRPPATYCPLPEGSSLEVPTRPACGWDDHTVVTGTGAPRTTGPGHSSRAFIFMLPFILTPTPEAGIANLISKVRCLCPLRSDAEMPDPAPVVSRRSTCSFPLKCWRHKRYLILKSLRVPDILRGHCGLVGPQLAEQHLSLIGPGCTSFSCWEVHRPLGIRLHHCPGTCSALSKQPPRLFPACVPSPTLLSPPITLYQDTLTLGIIFVFTVA